MKLTGDTETKFNIVLRGGEYYIGDTIEFSSLDSGRDFSPLTISAYEDENVILKQSISLNYSDFVSAPSSITSKIIDTSARDKIKCINLYDNGITDLGQITRRGYGFNSSEKPQGELYINGLRGTIARYPNNSYTNDRSNIFNFDGNGNKVFVDENDNEKVATSFTYTDSSNRQSKWSEPQQVWISGSMNANFSFDYLPVESIDGENKTVTISQGTMHNYYSKPFFFYENILEELDCENEYYVDYKTGNLYAYLPDSNTCELEFSVSKNAMLKFNDTKNITLKNLELEYGRDSGIVSSGEISGIKIDNCKIHGFGEGGISLVKANFSDISNSKVYDVGANGITISGGNYGKLYSNGNMIYNNEIYNCAQLKKSYFTGIHLGYQSVGTTVKNNYIHDTPHAALIFYGVNHTIQNNEFERCVTDFHDMNAIYSKLDEYPWEKGNVIKNNYFHNLGNEFLGSVRQMNVSAIRSDDFGPGLTVEKNLFFDIGNQNLSSVTNNLGGVVSQGIYNKINYNLFLDCSDTYLGCMNYNGNATTVPKYNDSASGAVKGGLSTHLSTYSRFFPELTDYLKQHHTVTKTNQFKNNAIINIAFPLSVYNDVNGNTRQSQGYRGASELVDASGNFIMNKNENYINYKDIFTDYDNKDFRMKNLSLLTSEINGFPSINVDMIGLVK